VLATGYFDQPRRLQVPGADLPKVRHRYLEAHPYFQRRVLIAGGRNSAIEAALEIHRAGGHVTLVHRRSGFDDKVKYWIKPDIINRIQNGEITAYFNSRISRIEQDSVTLVRDSAEEIRVPNDDVLVLFGFRPNIDLMRAAGITVDPENGIPEHDPDTLESNVAGLYIAGALTVGFEANRIFIENGRHHGEVIARSIAGRRRA